MKDLKEFVLEAAKPRYIGHWIDETGSNVNYFNSFAELKRQASGEIKYYDLYLNDNAHWDTTDVSGLVEWSGKGGYWANLYYANEGGTPASKYITKVSSREFEAIKKARK